MEQRIVTLFVLVTAMLLTAGINAISTKVLFMQHSTGKDGQSELFSKPWWGAFQMLFAMLAVGVVEFVFRRLRPARNVVDPHNASGVSLANFGSVLDGSGVAARAPERSYFCKALMVAVPGFFDLFATGLMMYGYVWTPTSVVSMLRGSCIIFSAMFSVIILRRKLVGFNWFGVFLCLLGIAIVGTAESMNGSDGDESDVGAGKVVLGMILVVSAQVVQALQLVVEEYLMKDVDLPSMQIIGWEGFWGCLLMIFVFYPLLWMIPGEDHGHLEDAIDTLYQIANNHAVFALSFTYVISCATFNAVGIVITERLTAVHRILIVALSTLLIWVFGLWVHYCFDATATYGEVWTPYSPVKVVGFIVLVFGQLVYGEVVRLPCFFSYANEPSVVDAVLKSPSMVFHAVTPPRAVRSPGW